MRDAAACSRPWRRGPCAGGSRLPRHPRQVDGSGMARSSLPPPPAPPSSTNGSPGWFRDEAPSAGSKRGGSGLLHGRPLFLPSFFPLLPPFSGGGEIGGKIPMGGAVQGGRCGGTLQGGALGFASAIKRWRSLGVRAHGHAARIGRDGAVLHGAGCYRAGEVVTGKKKSREGDEV
jgi:hypothetical protein